MLNVRPQTRRNHFYHLTTTSKQTVARTTSTIHGTVLKVLILIAASAITFLLFPTGLGWPWSLTPGGGGHTQPNPEPPPLVPFPTCPKSKFVVRFKYEFFGLRTFSLYETIHIPNLNSKVHVTRGTEDQAAHIIVHVQTGAMSIEDFSRVWTEQKEDMLWVTSAQRGDLPPFSDCGYVLNVINVRPGLKLWGGYDFMISTREASIEPADGADFETHSALTSSWFGDIAWAKAYDYFTRQYITARSVRGATLAGRVFGEWPLGQELQITAGGKDLKVDLKPYLWCSGPGTAGSLDVMSSGNIDIRMPFDANALIYERV